MRLTLGIKLQSNTFAVTLDKPSNKVGLTPSKDIQDKSFISIWQLGILSRISVKIAMLAFCITFKTS